MGAPEGSVTVLLDRLSAGDTGAFAQLIEAVYADVRAMSAARLRALERAGARGDWTIQPTVIANDVMLEFERQRSVPRNREHFFALAARIIMRILGDYRDAREALKRGGGWGRVPLEDGRLPAGRAEDKSDDAEAVQRALGAITMLHGVAPRLAEVATLRLYCQMPVARIAEFLEVSEATVHREWAEAKRRLREWCGEPAHD
jgi:RNA polymerase sigma factor (TIGR02999 family)